LRGQPGFPAAPGGNAGGKISYTRILRAGDFWQEGAQQGAPWRGALHNPFRLQGRVLN